MLHICISTYNCQDSVVRTSRNPYSLVMSVGPPVCLFSAYLSNVQCQKDETLHAYVYLPRRKSTKIKSQKYFFLGYLSHIYSGNDIFASTLQYGVSLNRSFDNTRFLIQVSVCVIFKKKTHFFGKTGRPPLLKSKKWLENFEKNHVGSTCD